LFISKYGYDVIGTVVLVALLGALAVWFGIELKPLKITLLGVFLAFLVFTLYFFRDPDRVTPSGGNLVVAPADGKVLEVREVVEDEYLKSPARQVSIFMSPLDVHVNRFPVSGTVGYFRHIPGEYLVAFDEKSSQRNERTLIGVDCGTFKVLFKQIAGFIARRIVADVKEGDRAVAGERFGMIKFGSRVDVVVPRGATVTVKPGDRAVAGVTVLAVVP
jgi:phosphatidylserine decarboxylase